MKQIPKELCIWNAVTIVGSIVNMNVDFDSEPTIFTIHNYQVDETILYPILRSKVYVELEVFITNADTSMKVETLVTTCWINLLRSTN